MSTGVLIELGQTFDGKFVILESLGAGGMGEVYKCRQVGVERLVALKLLSRNLADTESSLQRFEREAKILSVLDHRSIARFFLYGITPDSTPFIAMEYVDGEPLRQRMRQLGSLCWRDAVDIAIKICEALSYAHSKSVIHRDLKPENIVLADSGRVVIIDFGLAKVADPNWDSLTRTGELIGTTSYLSPELCRGYRPDHRSDLYSLGIILYEMISGSPPFVADHPMGVIYKHAHEIAPNLAVTDLSVPGQINWIIGRCIAKDPDDRYQNADELRSDLQSLLDNRIGAIKPPALASTEMHQHSGAVIVVLLAFIVVATFFVLVSRTNKVKSTPVSIVVAPHQPLRKISASDTQFSAMTMDELLSKFEALRISSRHIEAQSLAERWVAVQEKKRTLSSSEITKLAVAISRNQSNFMDFQAALTTVSRAIDELKAEPHPDEHCIIQLLTCQLAYGLSVPEFTKRDKQGASKQLQAANELQKLISKNVLSEPELALAVSHLANTKLAYSDFKGALELIDQPLYRTPRISRDLLSLKAGCLFQLGREDEAKEIATEYGALFGVPSVDRIPASESQLALNSAFNAARCAATVAHYETAVEMLTPALEKKTPNDQVRGEILLAYAGWKLRVASEKEKCDHNQKSWRAALENNVDTLNESAAIFGRFEKQGLQRQALVRIVCLQLMMAEEKNARSTLQSALDVRGPESADDVRADVAGQLWADLYDIRQCTHGSPAVPLAMMRMASEICAQIHTGGYSNVKEQVRLSLAVLEAESKK